MAAPSTPTSFLVQQGNRQVLASWDQMSGATSYILQRSLDNVTYTTIATLTGSPLPTTYLDTTVTTGTQYWYQVSASNGTQSAYTTPQNIIPTPTAEMSLAQIRLAAQQRADRVGSNFVTTQEWNSYINQSMYELYDLLIDTYEDYFIATPAQFQTDGSTYLYALPDGNTQFTNGITGTGTYTAPPYYKLKGVDLSINNANNAWVTVNRFNFIDRNRFVYPNTASTIYGVFNLQYRVMGNNLELIPTPSANQPIRIWYIPRLPQLLQDTDITTVGISGWVEYIIVRAAKFALDKEQSDTTVLTQEIAFLKQRIEEAASNRDAANPDLISDARQNGYWGSMTGGYGWNGPIGGY